MIFRKIILKGVPWAAVIFMLLSIFSLTIIQTLPYEFADYRLQQTFYETIIQGLPIAVLLTLFGTIRKENSNTKNLTYIALTTLISLVCLIAQLFLLFSFGFGTWTTMTTIYKHKYENREIKEQLYDIGAFGYGGRRIVEIKPFLHYWINPKPIDTLNINKSDWKFVNKQGDIKIP